MPLQEQMSSAAADLGERVLATPQNPISIAMTADSLSDCLRARQDAATATSSAAEVTGDTVLVSAAGVHGPATPTPPEDPTEHTGPSHAKSHLHALEDGTAGTPEGVHFASDSGGHGDMHARRPDGVGAAEGAIASGLPNAPEPVQAPRRAGSGVKGDTATVLGALMWQRHVSGVRVVCRGKRQTVGGVPFEGYGSSCDAYGHDYLTAAAALGGTREDVDRFVAKLRKCWARV